MISRNARGPLSYFALVCLTVFGLFILTASGCKQTGVGDPCIPEQEYLPDFIGFTKDEVNIESKSFQCQTRVCLVNHFQGRVSCPFGQTSDGSARAGVNNACTLPGKEIGSDSSAVTGNDLTKEVKRQCADRTADKAVYCSCRCANSDNKTDDGANYCACPDGYACTPLVNSIGAGVPGDKPYLAGSYCMKTGTDYKSDSCTSECDPTVDTKENQACKQFNVNNTGR